MNKDGDSKSSIIIPIRYFSSTLLVRLNTETRLQVTSESEKKAFDKYDLEVQKKEKNGVHNEELLQGDTPSNVKTGKYRHFEKCNLFELLDEQGWKFKHHDASRTYFFFHPVRLNTETRLKVTSKSESI